MHFYYRNIKYSSKFCTIHFCQRKYSQSYAIKKLTGENSKLINENEPMIKAVKYNFDPIIIYNSYIESYKFGGSYSFKKRIVDNYVKDEMEARYRSSFPLAVEKSFSSKNINDDEQNKVCLDDVETLKSNNCSISSSYFPLAQYEDVETEICGGENSSSINWENNDESILENSHKLTVQEDVSLRLKAYNRKIRANQIMKSSSLFISKDSKAKIIDNNNPEIYGDSFVSDLSNTELEDAVLLPKFGTPDPNIKSSDTPCGGCGAILHCQNQGLPGYIPSEMFRNKNRGELRSILCQRCHFLKNYDMAINVKVAPEVYERALQPIVNEKAAVIVVVDILDVPCSIWPGLFELLGPKRPVFVVGNKVDLLPPDRTESLYPIKKSFVGVLRKSCLWRTNIVHISLTSAKTGYGIEDLISRVQVAWGTKGNIYIVGCTNAGKSTLFNAFLGSDLCQIQATDLIQRATASHWPGTTLNLLKFPLMRPTGSRLFRRMKRLKMQEIDGDEDDLPKTVITKDYTKATLTGDIGQTFRYDQSPFEESDSFAIKGNLKRPSQVKIPHSGIKEDSHCYHNAKWLFDTPGTIQPDQLLALLTHDELMKVLPNSMIEPRTYSMKGGHTLFLGGLARIDLLYAEGLIIRLTVFASTELPITVVKTIDASSLYGKYVGTELMGVPFGPPSRMSRWPGLKPTNIKLLNLLPKGVSCCDVTLSSTGFVAVTGNEIREIDLRIWTPGGRGVYTRSPAMLPLAVRLRGNRIRKTPAYLPHKVYVPDMKVRDD